MPMTAKGLAKLIEECGELTQIAGKKLAYFHTDEHPDGKGSLMGRLAIEIGDVEAACAFVRAHLLNPSANATADAQRLRKFRLFQEWESMPENNNLGVDFLPTSQPAPRQSCRHGDTSGRCERCLDSL